MISMSQHPNRMTEPHNRKDAVSRRCLPERVSQTRASSRRRKCSLRDKQRPNSSLPGCASCCSSLKKRFRDLPPPLLSVRRCLTRFPIGHRQRRAGVNCDNKPRVFRILLLGRVGRVWPRTVLSRFIGQVLSTGHARQQLTGSPQPVNGGGDSCAAPKDAKKGCWPAHLVAVAPPPAGPAG